MIATSQGKIVGLDCGSYNFDWSSFSGCWPQLLFGSVKNEMKITHKKMRTS